MISEKDILEIGKFQKPHALKGELNAILEVDADYAEEGFPFIVDIDGIYVPFYIDSIRPKGAESFLVKLKGVNSQDEARQFVNKIIYGIRNEVEEYFGDEDLELPSDFIGYKIKDVNLGEIGIIKDIDDSTANLLFIVDGVTGSAIYIPVADEFINNIDDDKKEIMTNLPDGLIDLNS